MPRADSAWIIVPVPDASDYAFDFDAPVPDGGFTFFDLDEDLDQETRVPVDDPNAGVKKGHVYRSLRLRECPVGCAKCAREVCARSVCETCAAEVGGRAQPHHLEGNHRANRPRLSQGCRRACK